MVGRATDPIPEPDKLRRFWDLSPDLLCAVDHQWRFVYANPEWQRVLGWTPEERGDQSVLRFVHPDDIEVTQAEVARLLERGRSVDFDNRVRTKSGEWRWLSWSAHYSPGDGLIYAAARDVTQLRRTTEELRRERDWIELLQDITSAANAAADVDSALLSAIRRLCMGLDWAVGHAYVPEVAGPDQADPNRLVPTGLWYMADSHTYREFRRVTRSQTFSLGQGLPGTVMRDLRAVWVHDVTRTDDYSRRDAAQASGIRAGFAFPVHAGGSLAAVIELYATDVRWPDREVMELAERIGRQLGIVVERVQTRSRLESARLEAEATARNRADFLANMSHEIRTPLNAIIGMSDLLTDTELSERQAEYARTIATSGEHLMEILNEILDLSKLDAGAVSIAREPFHLRVPIEATLDLMASRAAEKGLDLCYEPVNGVPEAVKGDAARLRQVLINLVANAVKFTDDGEVTVRVAPAAGRERAEPDETPRLQFTVRDTGVGIEPEDLKRLFAPYQQAHSPSYGGTGLGLAISKRLVEMMGGEIWAESQPGQGSAFHFSIPLELADLPPADATPEPAERRVRLMDDNDTHRSILEHHPPIGSQAARLPLTILVAEDNLVNQLVVVRMLERLGYKPDTVDNGRAAVDAVVGNAYDLVLMDVEMPKMNGLEAIEAIRAAPTQQPWIVALTAHAGAEDRRRLLDVGADDYLAKPVTMTDLAEILRRPDLVRQVTGAAPRGRGDSHERQS